MSFTVNDVKKNLCVLILCTFYLHVVTAVCQLFNKLICYVMLCTKLFYLPVSLRARWEDRSAHDHDISHDRLMSRLVTLPCAVWCIPWAYASPHSLYNDCTCEAARLCHQSREHCEVAACWAHTEVRIMILERRLSFNLGNTYTTLVNVY